MATVRVPLSEQEEAHIALILEVHQSALAQIERAKAQRFAPIRKAHNIGEDVNVTILGRENGSPMFFVYDEPDITTVAGGSSQVREKSTDAEQASTGA